MTGRRDTFELSPNLHARRVVTSAGREVFQIAQRGGCFAGSWATVSLTPREMLVLRRLAFLFTIGLARRISPMLSASIDWSPLARPRVGQVLFALNYVDGVAMFALRHDVGSGANRYGRMASGTLVALEAGDVGKIADGLKLKWPPARVHVDGRADCPRCTSPARKRGQRRGRQRRECRTCGLYFTTGGPDT